MARLKVRVTKVEPKQGRGGTYAIAHLGGGRKAYIWDKTLAEALATPGVYEVETEVRQGFLRIVAAHPVAANGEAQGQGQAQGREERPQETATPSGSTQERLEALRLAVALAPHFGYTDVSQLLTVAERMVRWLRREG